MGDMGACVRGALPRRQGLSSIAQLIVVTSNALGQPKISVISLEYPFIVVGCRSFEAAFLFSGSPPKS